MTHSSQPWIQSRNSLLNVQPQPYFSTSRTDYIILEHHQTIYLEFRIPHDKTSPLRVMFIVTSHDQGWSSYPETWDAYRGSKTFFVVRTHKTDKQDPEEIKDIAYPMFLARNVYALSEPKTHTIMWGCEE